MPRTLTHVAPDSALRAPQVNARVICSEEDMPTKPRYRVAITRLTENGAYIYGGCEEFRGEATFTSTYNHCYFGELINPFIK